MPKASKNHQRKSTAHTVEAQHTSNTSDAATSDFSHSTVLVLILVCAAVFAVYSNAMTGQFLFDDRYSIVENNSIRSIWPLSQSMWGPRDMPTAGRPIANLSFAFNYAVGQLNVFGYHFANILIHAINSVLVFLFLQSTLKTYSSNDLWRTHAIGFAGMVTLLWALHPIQTETVSYATQRTELLMAFFFLLTLYAAKRAWDATTQRSELVWKVLSVVACGLGMGSKEVMVVAPVMVVLYDWTIMSRQAQRNDGESRHTRSTSVRPNSYEFGYLRHRWRLYIGLFATWGILGGLLATNPRGSSVSVDLGVGSFEYLALQFWAIVHYLRLSLWPYPLVGDYGEFKPIPITTWLPCLVVLLVLAGFTIWAWFRKRPWSFIGFWVFLILAPTSSIVPIETEPIAERRMYLPLAAVMFLLVAGVVRLMVGWSKQSPLLTKRLSTEQQRFIAVIIFLIATIYGVASFARNEVFRTELAFWIDVTQKLPQNSRGFNILGATYTAAKEYELAFANLKHAIAIEPGESGAFCSLGVLFTEQGNIAEAIAYFDQAIAMNPRLFAPFFNRGLLMLKQGQLDEAIKSLSAAIRINPNSSNTYDTLGSALFMKNEIDAAIENFRLAVELDPQSSGAYSNLGASLNRKGEFEQGLEMSKKSLAIEPMKPVALHNLADSLIGLERTDEAIPVYVECLNSNANDIHVLRKLGSAFVKVNQLENAKRCFEKILELKPDSPEAIRELEQLQQK